MNQKRSNKKILLTGGHAATTALAVIEELIRRSSGRYKWEIYFIGTKKAMEGKNFPTIESLSIPKTGVSFHPVVAGRIQRRFSIWTIPSAAKVPASLIHAIFLLRKIRPDIVLSFGGYASFGVVIASWLHKIPIVLHEQTATYGAANKIAAFFANKIALARASSAKYFPKDKIKVVGNPILTQIANITPKQKISEPPTIYITGGSRGSVSLNSLIEANLNQLLTDYQLIHQTGFLDFDKYKKIKDNLPKKFKNRYEVYPVIDPMQVDGVFKRADIIVSRAGANTVADIMAAKRPALLIPLPIAFQNEQEKNANFAKKFGIAKVLIQEKLSSNKLLSEINLTRKSWSKIVKNVISKKSPDIHAASQLVDVIEEQLAE